MQYARLGRSSLKVSRIALGAMGIGSPAWREWVQGEEASQPIVARALELGINLIDTCDFYSGGESESVVGRLVKKLARRDELVIATKGGSLMGKGPNARGFSRKHMVEAVDRSLARLGMDYIDIYQTHIWDPTTDLEEMADAFDALVRSGKVLYVGITDMPGWQFAKTFYYQKYKGIAKFASVQNHYNAIWREDERDLIPLCAAEGIGLIPYSPMGRGYLCGPARRSGATTTARWRTDDYAHKLYGRPSDDAVAEAIARIARERGAEPGQIALAWTLARPGVSAGLVGPTKVAHVDAAVKALDIKLEAAEIAAIEKPYLPRPHAGHGI